MATQRGARRRLHLTPAWILMVFAAFGCGDGSDQSRPPPATPTPAVEPSPSPTFGLGAGARDTGFGHDGLTIVPFGTALEVPQRGLRMAANGSVELLVITTHPVSGSRTLHAVVLPPDGRAEPPVVIPLLPDFHMDGAAWTQRGEALAAGREMGSGPSVLARLTRDRELDPSFGEAGLAPLSLSRARDITALADGGVLLVGALTLPEDVEPALQRLDARGRPDTSFSTDGFVRPPHLGSEVHLFLAAAAVDRDGRTLVAGTRFAGLGFSPVVLAYDRQGVLDPSFGSAGIATGDITSSGSPIAVDDDGAIVVGTSFGPVRFSRDGVFDRDYAARTREAALGIAALDLAPGGRVTAVGSTFVPDEPRRFGCETSSGGVCQRLALMVQRFLPDGTADPAFGVGGATVTDTASPYGAQDTVLGAFVAAPPDRITAAGIVCSAAFVCDLVVARYGDPGPRP